MLKYLITLLIAFGYAMSSFADAFILTNAMNASTIAEVYVEENKVRVELEIGAKDLTIFQNILPDAIYSELMSEKKSLNNRMREFAKHDLIIQADGKRLTAVLKKIGPRDRVSRDRITGESIKNTEEKVVFAVIDYPFKAHPNVISITPPMYDQTRVKTDIGFIVYHKQLAVNDFLYLVRTEKLNLNWQDPWYSKFEQKYLWRKNNLPVSLFIYVEPFEVREEIIIRPQDIQRYWADLGLAKKTIIKPEEKEEIKRRVTAFLRDKNSMMVDGVRVAPALDRINFIRRSLSKTQIVHQAEHIPVESAMLGVIYVHRIKQLPKQVSAKWSMFNDDIPYVYGSVVDEAGNLSYYLSKNENTLLWQNFLTQPSVPKLLTVKTPDEVLNNAGTFSFITKHFKRSPKIAEKDAQDVLLTLLKNIYHAFDFRDEDAIYDTLSMSTTGDLLTQIYLETQRSLVLKNQGDVKVRVKK